MHVHPLNLKLRVSSITIDTGFARSTDKATSTNQHSTPGKGTASIINSSILHVRVNQSLVCDFLIQYHQEYYYNRREGEYPTALEYRVSTVYAGQRPL